MSEGSGFRPPGGVGLAARVLLYVQAAVSMAAAAIGYTQGHDFDGSGDSPVYSMLSLIQLRVFVIGAIVFFVWLYRAVANAHALGARGFSSSPVMAIVWYFIPLGNLFMPYLTMRDTWKASTNPRDWEAADGSPAIGLWWFFWLAGNIAGIVVFRLVMEGEFDEVEAIGAPLSTLSDICTAAASVLLAFVIGRISTMQAGIAPAAGESPAPSPARIGGI